MAGNVNANDEPPNLDDNEAENESTVAMEAPTFDRGSVPLPVSDPPPKPVEAKPPVTAPPADRRAEKPAPAAPAAPARPSSARTPAARPAFAAAPPKVAPTGKPGKQTVIGLAPPAARPAGTLSGPRVRIAVPKPGAAAAVSPPEQTRAPAPSASSGGRVAFAATFPSPYSHAPIASGGPSRSDGFSKQNDASTVAVPKDVLDRVRAHPKAVLPESERNPPVMQYDDDDDQGDDEETKLAETAPAAPAKQEARENHVDDDDDYEETKAVPREELVRQQDAHVVVGADATGDDATLAVPPSENEAALLANIGTAIGGPPRQPMGFARGGAPHQQHPPPYRGMGGTMAMPVPQAWSSGQLPIAPRGPGAAPYGGGPMMGSQFGPPQGQEPTKWSPLQGPLLPPARRISGQMIFLLIVGVLCLAIFVTGIVLFATTKF